MKLDELRLENIIIVNDGLESCGNISKVTGMGKTCISVEYVEPSPVTKAVAYTGDILRYCGFEIDSDILKDAGFIEDKFGWKHKQMRHMWIREGVGEYYMISGAQTFICYFKYLHQLQNIFYDICEKQLKLKTTNLTKIYYGQIRQSTAAIGG